MRKVLLLLAAVFLVSLTVACGNGNASFGGTNPPSGPSGGNNSGYSNGNLSGNYVLSAHGTTTTGGQFASVASFKADGAGNITNGYRDIVTDGGSIVRNESFTGTYTVNADGRGQMVISGSSGQSIYRFVLQSSSMAKLFQISNTSDATGVIEAQSANVAGLNGTYITRLEGSHGQNGYASVGALTATGTTLTGSLDENDGGTFSALVGTSGTYSMGSNGRGTGTFTNTLGTHAIVFYIVSPSRIEIVGNDSNYFLFGSADLQGTFASSTAGLNGNRVFALNGFTAYGDIRETGRLTLDGSGNVTAGIEDYNEAFTYFDSVPFTGTYSVTSNGRWTASFNYGSTTLNLVGWQVSGTQSTLMTTDTTLIEVGTMRSQISNPSTASIKGPLAFELAGDLGSAGSLQGTVEGVGQITSDGAGNLTGTIDTQTPTSGNTDVATSGNYSVGADGRGTASINGVTYHIYVVDSMTSYLVAADSNRIYQGSLTLQQ